VHQLVAAADLDALDAALGIICRDHPHDAVVAAAQRDPC
jgi:hypothetical protein